MCGGATNAGFNPNQLQKQLRQLRGKNYNLENH
jgi:hypothetical protein